MKDPICEAGRHGAHIGDFPPAIGRVAATLPGIEWFHCTLMLNYELPMASSTLAEVEHRVLKILLVDYSEKNLSRQLN